MKEPTSLKSTIISHINTKGIWVNGGEIERLAEDLGYKASNASRRCREIYNSGLVERRIRNGSVEYKCKDVEILPERYSPKYLKQLEKEKAAKLIPSLF